MSRTNPARASILKKIETFKKKDFLKKWISIDTESVDILSNRFYKYYKLSLMPINLHRLKDTRKNMYETLHKIQTTSTHPSMEEVLHQIVDMSIDPKLKSVHTFIEHLTNLVHYFIDKIKRLKPTSDNDAIMDNYMIEKLNQFIIDIDKFYKKLCYELKPLMEIRADPINTNVQIPHAIMGREVFNNLYVGQVPVATRTNINLNNSAPRGSYQRVWSIQTRNVSRIRTIRNRTVRGTRF